MIAAEMPAADLALPAINLPVRNLEIGGMDTARRTI
jgi:hypothetical protein